MPTTAYNVGMPEHLAKRVNVSAMGGDERRSVEQLLGHSLHDDEQVYILAFKPGIVPDEATRRNALASMRRTFEKAERHSAEQKLTDAEIDDAIDQAVDEVRYGTS